MAKKHNTTAGATKNAMKRMFCAAGGGQRWHNKCTKKSIGTATLWRCTCCGVTRG